MKASASLLQATLITPAAREWMERDSPRRVLHLFEQTCNLMDGKGEVASLVTSQDSLGPFSILVVSGTTPAWSGFNRWFTVDAAVRVEGTTLLIDSNGIETREAGLWDPLPAWNETRPRLPTLMSRLPKALHLLQAHAPPHSFAPLAVSEYASTTGNPHEEVMDGALQAAQEPAQRLSAALAKGDLAACRQSSAALAGLGGGLTPSGDDYLVGCMHALWLRGPRDRAAQVSGAMADAATPNTTPLSGAWLRAAARGEAGWPWHALLESMVEGEESDLETTLLRVVALGHTSGADALAGFIRSIRAIAG